MSFNTNLQQSWETTTLGDVCKRSGGDIQTGPFGSQLHASDYVASGIPSIMPQNIGDNRVIEEGIARITPEDAQRLSRYLVRKGDIVYSRRGDVERRALIREDEEGWLCGTGCLRIRFGNSIVNPVYASYYLGHPDVRAWIVQHAHGATMPNLNTSILSDVPFVLPPYLDQEAIASLLSSLDDKIELNNRINKTLEEMAQAIFRRWFVDFEFPDENGNPYKSSGGEMVESEMGLIPKGWRVGTIGEISSFVSRGITPKYADVSDVRVINQKCIRDGKVTLELARYHAGPVPEDKKVRFGDVLINSTGEGTLGRVSQYYLNSGSITIDSHVTIARCGTFCSIEYYGMALCNLQYEFESAASGSTGQTELSRDAIKGMILVIPNPKIDVMFSSITQFVKRKITATIEESKIARETRDSILPRLIPGSTTIR